MCPMPPNSRQMRILMISQYYPPFVGGYAVQCAETSRLLRERGHEVCVLTSLSDSGAVAAEGVLGLLACSPTEGYQSLRPAYVARQARRRRIFLNNSRIAHTVAQDFKPHVALIWQFEALGIGLVQTLQRLGVLTVFNVEDPTLCSLIVRLKNESNPIWRMGRRWLYHLDKEALDISHLSLVSQPLKAYYLDHGFSEQQITLIPNGIDERYIVDAPPESGTGNRLLYAGRLHPTKGVDIAIRALALLNGSHETRCTLDIIGTGPGEYVGELEVLGRDLGLHEDLHFLGPRSWDALIHSYEGYDMLLFPSVWVEPFGLTVVEAMARGVPVIASDRGGPRDIITDRVDGLLVEPENPEAFADAVALLVSRPDLRKTMAMKALQKIKGRFTLQKNTVLTEQLLLHVINAAGVNGSA